MSTCVQKEIVRQSDVLCEEAGTKVTDVDIVLKYRAPHVPQVSALVGDPHSATLSHTTRMHHACNNLHMTTAVDCGSARTPRARPQPRGKDRRRHQEKNVWREDYHPCRGPGMRAL